MDSSSPSLGAAESPTDSSEPQSGNAGSTEPQGVTLLGVSPEVWTQLIVALSILATAVAAYLGRNKIPGVKELTKEGRAQKKIKERLAEEDPPLRQ